MKDTALPTESTVWWHNSAGREWPYSIIIMDCGTNAGAMTISGYAGPMEMCGPLFTNNLLPGVGKELHGTVYRNTI